MIKSRFPSIHNMGLTEIKSTNVSTVPTHDGTSLKSSSAFPFVEESIPDCRNGDSEVIKQQLITTLRSLIPHSTSLTIRLIVTYAIDDGDADVIVIDETLRRSSTPRDRLNFSARERDRSPMTANTPKVLPSSVLDLSRRQDSQTIPLQPVTEQNPVAVSSLNDAETELQMDLLSSFTNGMLNPSVLKPTQFAIDPNLLALFTPIQDRQQTQQVSRIAPNPGLNIITPNIASAISVPRIIPDNLLLLQLQTLLSLANKAPSPMSTISCPLNFTQQNNGLDSRPSVVSLPAFVPSPDLTLKLPTVSHSFLSMADTNRGTSARSADACDSASTAASVGAPSNYFRTAGGHLLLGADSLVPKGAHELLVKAECEEATGQPTFSSSVTNFSRRFVHGRRFMCNQCREHFPSLAELNRHTLEQHNTFKCNYCQANFTQRSNLQRHSLKHVGFKPFTCKICNKEYYRKDHLVRHIEVTHPSVDPRANITVRLTSSECLEFLDNLQAYPVSLLEQSKPLLLKNGPGAKTRPDKEDSPIVFPTSSLQSGSPPLQEKSGIRAASPVDEQAEMGQLKIDEDMQQGMTDTSNEITDIAD